MIKLGDDVDAYNWKDNPPFSVDRQRELRKKNYDLINNTMGGQMRQLSKRARIFKRELCKAIFPAFVVKIIKKIRSI